MQEEKNTSNSPQNSDEIDLRQLFQAIGNFFRGIFRSIMLGILHFRNSTIRNFKLLLIFLIGGVISGIIIKQISKPYYQSSLILKSQYLNNRLVESTINKLDKLCDEDSYKQLAKTLGVDEATAAKIHGFSYETFIPEDEVTSLEVFKEKLRNEIKDEATVDKVIAQLKIENINTFKITIEVYDNAVLKKLENPLVKFFEDNPYVQKRISINHQNLKDEKEELEGEIGKLDSIKALFIKNLHDYGLKYKEGSNNVILGDDSYADPLKTFSETQDLFAQKQNVEQKLYIQPDFELIDGFTVFSKPETPNFFEAALLAGGLSLLLAYLLIGLISFNQYLSSLEEKR